MAVFSRLFVSSALAAIALLSAAPESAVALSTHGHGHGHLAARHHSTPTTTNVLLRKRESKNEKRCAKKETIATVTAAPASNSPAPGNGNSNNNNNNNGGGSASAYAGRGKFIMAWPNGDDNSFASYAHDRVGYYYSWSPWKVNVNTNGVKFAPMLWGWHQVDDFTRLVVEGYADVVLGMNEPNEASQSAMSSGDAAYLWNTYIGPLRYKGYRLGSPACTNGPTGVSWMNEFLGQVGEKPDFLALHWYGYGAQNFIDYVNSFRSSTGYHNVWITEFACHSFGGGQQCNEGDIWNFMHGVRDFLDNTPWVEAYAPFGMMRNMQGVSECNRLMNGDGTPTNLAFGYIS